MVRLGRKVFLVALFLSFCFMISPTFSGSLRADNTLVKVYGRVTDAKTHQPIPNVSLIFFAPPPAQWEYFIVRTNASGIYEVNVTGAKDYGVFASYDYSLFTLGVNYVPASRRISVANEPLNVSFDLLPGATISIIGFFCSPTIDHAPIRWQHFYVIDKFGLLNKTDAIIEFYIQDSTIFAIGAYGIAIDAYGILVPADTPVKLRGEIQYQNGSRAYFTIDREGDYLNLAQGSLTFINLYMLWLSKHPGYVTAPLQRVKALVDKAEAAGFYVPRERSGVSRAENLIGTAYAKKAEGDLDTAYADLHEALLILEEVEEGFRGFFLNAAQSVLFITPLLGFTAVASASVIFENWRRRLTASLILYVTLFGLLYVLYPGYRALQGVYNPLVGTSFEALLLPLLVVTSFVVASFLILGVPQMVRERTSMEGLSLGSAIAAAFAIAARNLKRRRFRTLLTSAMLLTSVFSLTALTSVSFEKGFFVQPKPGQAPSEGFLLRYLPPDHSEPWQPIDPVVLEWLRGRPETALVVPKFENKPAEGGSPEPVSIGTIEAPKTGLWSWLSGVLGVYPSLETQVTKMDTIVTAGRFLEDEDLGGILISSEAAQKLQAGINDTVVLYGQAFNGQAFNGQAFNVTGIFDSGKLEGLRDLDGESLVPWYVQVTESPGAPPSYKSMHVPSSEVVIVHAETAKGLPNIVISRVDVQTQNPNDIMTLARLTVLYWPSFQAFASTATGIYSLFIGSYSVIMGFPEGLIPLVLVILNVGIVMGGAVHERKREIFTMSSVGLNPLHVSAVFLAEALVIGVLAGGFGYILGLVGYRFMALLPFLPLVRQKVEAIWGIFAISLSIAAAVLGSAIPALKASLTVTPSLLRKWRITVEEKPKRAGEPWLLAMPIQIQKGEIEEFFSFMERRLREYAAYPYLWINNLKVSGGGAATRLSFTYTYTVERSMATENELFPVESLPDRYAVKLASKILRGTIKAIDEADVWQTASFIRSLILQYSAIRTPKNKAAKSSRKE